jgi:hypothetical protein
MRFLSFNRFKEEYKDIEDENIKHELFYLSLFDISFQDLEKSDIMRRIWKDVEKKVKERIPHFFKKGIFKKMSVDDFIQKNVYNDRLCKFIIAFELEKQGVKCGFSKSDDLVINKNRNIIIEIKRVVTGTQLDNYIKEIEKKYENSESKILALLLFPQFGDENYERVSRLTEIYYIIESYLMNRLKNVKVLCQYITEIRIEEYSISKLIERTVNIIKSLEEKV